MSTWYNYKVKAIAANKEVVTKFFNLKSNEDHYTLHFDFSFGGKNGSGINLNDIAEQNPDLILLVNETIECQAGNNWIMRFDNFTKKIQSILLYSCGYYGDEINKKILEEYSKKYPTLVAKHLAKEKGYESFRWSQFFSTFDKAALMLRQEDQYKEMVYLMTSDDSIIDNDFSHLELDNDK